MPFQTIVALLAIGLLAGFLSGMVGIGGGVVIVPLLVYLLGYSQQMAQGTTLFMFLFPIGILGVMNYYKGGLVDYRTAIFVMVTFVVGSYYGSKLAIKMDGDTLKKVFGAFLVLIGIKLLLGK